MFATFGKSKAKKMSPAERKLRQQWQKSGAYRTISFADWYKAKRSAQVDALVDSWFIKKAS